MENPIKTDDDEGYPYDLGNLHLIALEALKFRDLSDKFGWSGRASLSADSWTVDDVFKILWKTSESMTLGKLCLVQMAFQGIWELEDGVSRTFQDG